MSRMTDETGKQSYMYCGFYPSNKGDRIYGNSDFGRFLNGIVCDGVFSTIYDQFKVSPASAESAGRAVVVGTGKAWFNGTWLELTEEYEIECDDAYADGDRYDAIVIAINISDDSYQYTENGNDVTLPPRDTTIAVMKGPKSLNGSPTIPFGVNASGVYESEIHEGVYIYPIADIYRGRSTSITTSDIYYKVGTKVCPYVTALVTPSNNATEFTEMWNAQLDNYINGLESKWRAEVIDVYDAQWSSYSGTKQQQMTDWFEQQQAAFENWFNWINDQMSIGDTGADLLQTMTENVYESYLLNGFPFATTTVSDDGKTITSIEQKYGFKLVKKFSDDFTQCSIILYDSADNVLGSRYLYISEDGSFIQAQNTRPSPEI